MVVPLFTLIKNKNLTPRNWPKHPYSEKILMKKIYVVPIKDKRNMNFIFVYPDEIKHYKSAVRKICLIFLFRK